MLLRPIATGSVIALLLGLLAACGGSSSSSSSSVSQTTAASSQSASATTQSTSSQTGVGAGALSAEVRSAATGDIPDNQVFLTFRDPQAGYQIVYPEGWAQQGSGDNVTIQDKNNIIHVVVSRGSAPTPAAVTAQLAKTRQTLPSLTYGAASTISIQGSPVIKISYSTLSQPNAVTGKRVQLLVDRYVYAHAGKVMILDLGTAKGVDNVDAYKKIAQSLRWQ